MFIKPNQLQYGAAFLWGGFLITEMYEGTDYTELC